MESIEDWVRMCLDAMANAAVAAMFSVPKAKRLGMYRWFERAVTDAFDTRDLQEEVDAMVSEGGHDA